MTSPTTEPAPALEIATEVRKSRYPIYLQAGLLPASGPLIRQHLFSCGRVLLVSDEVVFPLYGEKVQSSLQDYGFQVEVALIPSGETRKTLEEAEKLYDAARTMGLSRQDAVLALGGGVVGDLAGFVAATYMRGTGFVQIPTTLLAQVDSSVGGKVGVNFQDMKNAVGAFYQPDLVLMDTVTLQSLPDREWRAGLAEVAKYALIENTCDPEAAHQALLNQLLQAGGALLPGHPALEEIIRRCCQIKGAVVAADETEKSGIRAFLNLGHTFAHAYEELTEYRQWRHGEAVAIGLGRACRLSERLGLLPPIQAAMGLELLDVLRLPRTPEPLLSPEDLLVLMRHDKKAHGGKIRFVLPVESLGQVALQDDVSDEDVLAVLQMSN